MGLQHDHKFLISCASHSTLAFVRFEKESQFSQSHIGYGVTAGRPKGSCTQGTPEDRVEGRIEVEVPASPRSRLLAYTPCFSPLTPSRVHADLLITIVRKGRNLGP